MPDAHPAAAFLPQMVEGNDIWLVAAAVLPILLGIYACLPSAPPASWPGRGRWIATAFALGPAVLAVLLAAISDGVAWFAERHPVPVAILIGIFGIAAAPVLALTVKSHVWRAGLAWGLPLLAGGIAVFIGDVLYALYLGQFGLGRSDVSVAFSYHWALGAFVALVLLSGAYPGVAFWAVGRRFLGPSVIGTAMASLVTIIYVLSAILAVLLGLQQRAELDENGLPDGLLGLEPRLACVVPVAGPYSYVGQPVDPAAGPVVYFGRADGRLAVWSARSGPTLLDGQAVGLRYVPPGSTCG